MMPIITNKFDLAIEIAKKNNIPQNSPDFILVTPENSIGIEKIREVISTINLKPYQSLQKIVVIQNAHKMTPEAQNSFLKTLEEPPKNTFIVLLVENEDQLLPTILSRCQIINLVGAHLCVRPINDILEIQKMPLGLRFKKASEIAVNRESAQNWLKNAIFTLHENVNESAEIIIKFQKALKKLDQNVNTRLVLENLLASI